MAATSSPAAEHSDGRPGAPNDRLAAIAAGGRGQRHTRLLLIVVIALGVLLLVGFGAVVLRVIYLAGQPARVAPSAVIGSRSMSMPLPPGAQIRHTSLAGDRLAVTYDSPRHSGIVVVDIATGQVLSRIELVEEVPSR